MFHRMLMFIRLFKHILYIIMVIHVTPFRFISSYFNTSRDTVESNICSWLQGWCLGIVCFFSNWCKCFWGKFSTCRYLHPFWVLITDCILKHVSLTTRSSAMRALLSWKMNAAGWLSVDIKHGKLLWFSHWSPVLFWSSNTSEHTTSYLIVNIQMSLALTEIWYRKGPNIFYITFPGHRNFSLQHAYLDASPIIWQIYRWWENTACTWWPVVWQELPLLVMCSRIHNDDPLGQ